MTKHLQIQSQEAMRCAHCERELAGVAAIFPGKPAICGRADCLGWARALVLPAPTVLPTTAEIGRAA